MTSADRSDSQLLADYAGRRDQEAFALLVQRHVDWAYSTAARITRDAGLADDVTQGVFLTLAQKAGKLAGHPSLTGWLFRATQFGARSVIRRERIRRFYEAQAMTQANTTAQVDRHWEAIRWRLEEAIGKLRSRDREAILLRFYRQLSLNEVAQVLGVGEEAARKRVARAVACLRKQLAGESEAILSAALMAHVVTKAPPHLMAGLIGGGHTAGATGVSKGIKALFAHAKLKLVAAAFAILAPLAAGPIFLMQERAAGPSPAMPATIPVTDAAAAPLAGNLPFTIGHDTTRITGPLRADGTIDYVAAINEKYGAGVTPGNNGWVLWTQLESARTGKAWNQALAMAGASPLLGLQGWIAYLPSQDAPGAVTGIESNEQAALRKGPWRAEDHPAFAAYLKDREKSLAVVAEAVNRPRWWMPAVSTDGPLTDYEQPNTTVEDDVGSTLCERALMRAGQGDFDGFLADILTARRLALAAAGWETGANSVAGFIDVRVDPTVAAAVISGKFSAAQWRAAGRALDAIKPLPPLAEVYDTMQRWEALDVAQSFATGRGRASLDLEVQALKLKGQDITPEVRRMMSVDWQAVDWNVVMKQMNDIADRTVAMMTEPRLADAKAAAADLYRQNRRLVAAGAAQDQLGHRPDEAPGAYSQRIADAMVLPMLPIKGKSVPVAWNLEDRRRKIVMMDQMTRLLVAAAEYHAETGAWPQALEELTPKYIAEIPVDIYSPSEMEPVRYVLGTAGPTVYSVGPDAVDNGGKGDDLAIGAN